MVDNREVGELDKNGDGEPRKVVKPNFTTDFPAVVWKGADELTMRADEQGALRTYIDTTNVGDKKMGASSHG